MFRVKHLLAGLAVGFGLATSAFAWPDKAITIIVPFPPGGSTDTLARAIAPGLQAQLGQNVIVENKPGATGTIGAGLVKRAPADGYTLFVSSLGPFVIAPHLYKSVAYDPNRDFDLLTVAVQAPNVLVVPAASPFKTVADVLAQLKKSRARRPSRPRAMARPTTSPRRCSGSRLAPPASMCPTRAARRP